MRRTSIAILCLSFSIVAAFCTVKSQDSFAHFFHFERTQDVKDLHYFSDKMGIDASYWLSFSCDDSTVNKIVASLNLKPDIQYSVATFADGQVDSIPTDGQRFFGGLDSRPTEWWDTALIRKTTPYSRKDRVLRWHLWHDTLKHRVYFLHYDL